MSSTWSAVLIMTLLGGSKMDTVTRTHTCECGIKCQPFGEGGHFVKCPRCDNIYWMDEGPPKRVTQEDMERVGRTITSMMQVIGKAATKIAKKIVKAGHPSIEVLIEQGILCRCEVCQYVMENECGAICKNCQWVKPCDI